MRSAKRGNMLRRLPCILRKTSQLCKITPHLFFFLPQIVNFFLTLLIFGIQALY